MFEGLYSLRLQSWDEECADECRDSKMPNWTRLGTRLILVDSAKSCFVL